MIPNPWIILGAVLVVLSLMTGSEHFGYARGQNAKARADQVQFDQINHDIEQQKAIASTLLAEAHAKNTALQVERDTIKTQLEKDHVAAQFTTNALRTQLAASGLRFRATDAGCGQGGTNPLRLGPGAAGDAATAVVELPAALASDLRQLAYDADTVRDNDRTLYEWAHSNAVKCSR